MVAGIMFQIDRVINEAHFHAGMISKALKQKQTQARLSPQVLLLHPKNIYAEGSMYFPDTERAVL
jgi:hypothetical protein